MLQLAAQKSAHLERRTAEEHRPARPKPSVYYSIGATRLMT